MSQKILVVDDSLDMRELLALVFEPEGYIIEIASDGRQALEILSSKPLPDLIFLDHEMDVMDGPQFLLELERVQPEILTRIPIILLTGMEIKDVAPNRATEVLAKQDGIESLLSTVKRHLGAPTQSTPHAHPSI